ncbi:MAG: hypothetical protein NC102_10695, partial [Clostridium sp.]|nr:hypothetical protein [Clostridium sp.]
APYAPAPAQPAAAQPRAASHTATPSIKRPTISLSIKGKGKAEAPEQAHQTAPAAPAGQARANAYTEEALLGEWAAFADARPTERILVNTMLACRPTRVDADRYFVAVDDTIQVEKINEFKYDILMHLRDKLSNDNIEFDVRISQRDASPVTWTNREVLQHMVKEHPAIAGIINDFGFQLD